jgi:hypothetical protein
LPPAESPPPFTQAKPRRGRAIREGALLALCAGLIIGQLFVPPILGVADNGDFPKLIGRVCLGSEHPLFEYVGFDYRTSPNYCWNSGLLTSAQLPFRVALAAATPFSGGRFDLRWLGAVYALLFLGAFAAIQILVRGLPVVARMLTAASVLFVFCGASYIPWFNSFYFDTASYVFLWFAILAFLRLMLRESVNTRDYLAALASVLLLETSKSQHTALALPLIACFWLRFGRATFPRLPLRIAATAAIAAAAVVMFASAPAWYQTVNSYNALFYQSLPHSADPAADIAQLGMDPAMVRYVGQHAFLPDSPMQNPRETERLGRFISVRSLTNYYLRHPRIALLVFRYALDEGSLQRVSTRIGTRQYRLGNYEKSTGKAPEAQSHFFDFWSDLKAAVFGDRPELYAGYAAVLLAALWGLALSRPAKLRARLIAIAAIWTAMVTLSAVLVMFDGVDTGRHLFLFNAMLDMTACGLLCFT